MARLWASEDEQQIASTTVVLAPKGYMESVSAFLLQQSGS